MSFSPALDLSLHSLQYPIGPFASLAETRLEAVAVLANLPGRLRDSVAGLSEAQLETPYREHGWTVRQVVHHVADSHLNAYVRIRLALTEAWPTIRPYEEARWAELPDARGLPVEVSLLLLDPLHRRLVTLLESLREEEWQRGYVHPEMGRMALDEVAARYSWHSRHHTAHITELRRRRGW